MRFADLLRLALSALFQQKVRSVLTTLGVVFGTFVLVVSVAVGRGVQDTVIREYSRFGDLRKVQVNPDWPSGEKGVPEKELRIDGKMSDTKRERLRQEAARRWRFSHRLTPEVKLTAERVAELGRMEHVVSAVPTSLWNARALLGSRREPATVMAAPPSNAHLRGRVVAGAFFPPSGGGGVLVSEYLLYRLGMRDDDDVERAVGRPLRLEFPTRASPLSLVSLLGPNPPPVTTADEPLLQKVVQQLPEALKKMDLTPEDREKLTKLLTRRPDQLRKTDGTPVMGEYVLCGVLRSGEDKTVRNHWDRLYDGADVVLPAAAAEDLFGRFPSVQANGFSGVVLEVDDVAHVKEVCLRVRDKGLHASALMELIEAEQFMYLLIFAGMTVVAAVSLLVAALGITNTMLMSVLERVREIGIMKAVGARDGHVQWVFVVEGALIGLLGGLLGLLLGWVVSFPADAWVRSLLAGRTPIKLEGSVFTYPAWLVAGAPAFACLVTTLAAVYPARRAARVDPVTALRHE
jgi:putative ABC transport system permease protein